MKKIQEELDWKFSRNGSRRLKNREAWRNNVEKGGHPSHSKTMICLAELYVSKENKYNLWELMKWYKNLNGNDG